MSDASRHTTGSRHQSVCRSQSSPPGTSRQRDETVESVETIENGHTRFRRMHSEQKFSRQDDIPEEGEVFFNKTTQINI